MGNPLHLHGLSGNHHVRRCVAILLTFAFLCVTVRSDWEGAGKNMCENLSENQCLVSFGMCQCMWVTCRIYNETIHEPTTSFIFCLGYNETCFNSTCRSVEECPCGDSLPSECEGLTVEMHYNCNVIQSFFEASLVVLCTIIVALVVTLLVSILTVKRQLLYLRWKKTRRARLATAHRLHLPSEKVIQ